MNRAQLLAAVTAERLDHRWFATPAPEPVAFHDDELATARRRRALADDKHADTYLNNKEVI